MVLAAIASLFSSLLIEQPGMVDEVKRRHFMKALASINAAGSSVVSSSAVTESLRR